MTGEWSGLDAAQTYEEKLYFQDTKNIEHYRGERAIKTGSAPSDAEGAIDTLTPEQVQIKITKPRDTDRWQKTADKRVRFATGLLHDWRTPRDLIRLVSSDQVVRRTGVARVLWDRRRWPDHPAGWKGETEDFRDEWELRHRTKCPIVFEARNPRYVRWKDLQDGTLLSVVEHYPLSVPDAKVIFAQYPRAVQILKGYSNTANQIVWVDDLWIGEYRCILLEDQPILTQLGGNAQYQGVMKSPYPEIPYIMVPYREMNFENPAERYRGMLTNSGDLYLHEAEVLGMITQMVRFNSWRTWKGYFHDFEKTQIEVIPGTVLQVKKHQNEYIEPMTGETFPPDLMAPMQMYEGYIGRNSVVTGGSASGEQNRSAQQAWANMAIRQLKLNPARQSLQTGVSQALRLATVIGSLFLEDETLVLPLPGRDEKGKDRGSVSIKASDLENYPDCYTVKFGAPVDPARIELAKALFTFANNNAMPLRTAIEMSGLTEVAQDWIDDLRGQRIESVPGFAELAALEQLEDYYEDDPEKMAIFKMFLMQQKQGPGGGGPPPGGPAVPSPGGMQVPNAMARTGMQNSEAEGLSPGPPGGARPRGRVSTGRPPGMPAGGGVSGGGSL
jgi:hypothetical protein